MENWNNLGYTINNAFFFVVDKIISIQSFFIKTAYSVGSVVLLIALLSAALNYILTGQNLKENMIKILKATLFFLIVIAAYPRVIGWITNFTYDLAYKSVGSDVSTYYDKKLVTMNKDILQYSHSEARSDGTGAFSDNGSYTTDVFNTVQTLTAYQYMSTPELKELFSKITEKRSVKVDDSILTYTSFAPAAVIQLLMITASNAFEFADNAKTKNRLPDFSKILKGLICGFFLIFTGIFALIEYLVCLLEFMLIASVGVILFPASIWEGSKFLSEKFIGAIVGFFMKLMFCNIAVFLLLYGYVSMFHILGTQKFAASIDQVAFILFTCLLFFFICKSAPALAQSLLTGTPSLNAAGAIAAASGAVAAVAATAGIAGKIAKTAGTTAGAVAGGTARSVGGMVGSFTEANAAKEAAMAEVAGAGGTVKQQKQAGKRAFFSSVASDVGDSIKTGALGLARSISGDKSGTNPHSWRQDFNNSRNADGSSQSISQHLDKRKAEGSERGKASAQESLYG